MGTNDTTEDGVDLQDDRKGSSIAEKSKEEPIEMNNGFESAQIMDVNTEKLQRAKNGEKETCLIKVEEPEELVVLVCESQSEKIEKYDDKNADKTPVDEDVSPIPVSSAQHNKDSILHKMFPALTSVSSPSPLQHLTQFLADPVPPLTDLTLSDYSLVSRTMARLADIQTQLVARLEQDGF